MEGQREHLCSHAVLRVVLQWSVLQEPFRLKELLLINKQRWTKSALITSKPCEMTHAVTLCRAAVGKESAHGGVASGNKVQSFHIQRYVLLFIHPTAISIPVKELLPWKRERIKVNALI